jgi:hypothetical protein
MPYLLSRNEQDTAYIFIIDKEIILIDEIGCGNYATELNTLTSLL